MQQNDRLGRLFQELKRRHVFRVTTLYVVLGWPAIQIADLMQPVLGVPDSTIRMLLFGFIAGLPLVLALSWIYDLTPQGIVRTGEANTTDDPAQYSMFGRGTEIAIIIGLLLLSGALLLLQTNIQTWVAQRTEQASVEPQRAARAAAPRTHSIAVLPFVSFSDDKRDGYFADGLTEELLNGLAKVRLLRVAARTSSFAYKGVNRNVQEVGRELGVNNILEGSVRRNDVADTVRVTAQLIDVDSGTHLWSETYDREYRDVFRIQDEIAMAVVDQLQVSLLGDEAARRGRAQQLTSPEALVALGMGREAMAARRADELEIAAQHFLTAIDHAPNYAEAHAALGETYALLSLYGNQPKRAVNFQELAQQSIDEALRLDPELGAAWAAQGLQYMNTKRPIEAKQALEKAIQLNPSYAMAYMWYGNLQNDPQQQLKHFRMALELDPRSAVAAQNVASTLLNLGFENESMQVFSQIIEADPLYPGAYKLAALINEQRGRLDEAILNYQTAWEIHQDWSVALKMAQLYLDLGDLERTDIWMARGRELAGDKGQMALSFIELAALETRGEVEEFGRHLAQNSDYQGEDLFSIGLALMSQSTNQDYEAVVATWDRLQETANEQGTPLSPTSLSYLYAAAAHAFQQLGDEARSRDLREAVRQVNDATLEPGQRQAPNTWYSKAQMHALAGNTRLALISLQRAIDEGWTSAWRIRIDPIMAAVREEEDLQEILDGLKTRLELMREQLTIAQTRDRGFG
jgi:TolB-like protein/Flp pilus assembly protein TadD